MSQRAAVAALTLLAMLMAAGVVHVASLLIVPRVAPDDAYGRLAAATPEGTLSVLAAGASQGAVLPERDPSLTTAVCRYDLGRGPLRVVATLGDAAYVALTLHSRSGIAFYGLDDRSRNGDRVEFVVMTGSQIEEAQARDAPDVPLRDIRVAAPEAQGFVMFDVLPRVGGEAAARRALSLMGCRVEHAP